MKKYFLILLLGLLPLAASAQMETGFFAGAGAGMNFGFDGQSFNDRPTSHNGAGFAGDIYAGGWLNKTIGFRAGYQGFSISDQYTDFGNQKFQYIHADVLLRPHRNIVPYLHGGWTRIVRGGAGGGAGIMLPIHLGKHLVLVPDVKATAFASRVFDRMDRNIAFNLSATVGLAYRFGISRKAKAEEEPITVIPPLVPAGPGIGAAKTDTLVFREIARDTVYVEKHDTVYVRDIIEPETINAQALFDTNSYELRKEALPELDKIAAWFLSHPAAKGRIEGHTDNTASAAHNQKLSENRAMAVYIYLIDKGVSAARLSYEGFGFSRPVASNDTPEGRQQNRRVEIVVE